MWGCSGSPEVRITSEILPCADVEAACPQQPHECAPGGALLGFYNIFIKNCIEKRGLQADV